MGGDSYREIEGLAGFGRNCVCAASLVCHVCKVVLDSFKKKKSLRREAERYTEETEEKGNFKIELC